MYYLINKGGIPIYLIVSSIGIYIAAIIGLITQIR